MFEGKGDVVCHAVRLAVCAPLFVGCVDPAEDGLGSVDQATICGPTDDSWAVNAYAGSFPGFSAAYVQTHKGPVGALETTNSNSQGVKYCSGTLISSNLFLTAGHCADPNTIPAYVSFNYEFYLVPPGIGPQTHVAVEALVEHRLGGLDYAILRLAGNPGATFGIAPVASADAAVGSAIAMIGHPAGAPKRVEAGTVLANAGQFIRYNDVDALGGSSGSALRDSAGQIVGVHTTGGCTATGGWNQGVRIVAVRAASNLL